MSFIDFSSPRLWLHGYLPVDASGDWVFQAVDLLSLALVLYLLHSLLFEKKRSYEEEHDTFCAAPVVVSGLIVAGLFHADMNARPVFDTLWMAGLCISAVAVLPQVPLGLRKSFRASCGSFRRPAAEWSRSPAITSLPWRCREASAVGSLWEGWSPVEPRHLHVACSFRHHL